MRPSPKTSLIDEMVRSEAIRLRPEETTDYDPLLEAIGDARLVLLGEASHGTHEFYSERARITKRLILEKGFDAVAVEADFPDAHRVDRYIRGENSDKDAEEAFRGFKRFPQWMWRNAEVLDFVGWLRAHNEEIGKSDDRIGFHGLDLYSLHTSINSIIDYLSKIDPKGAERARARYSCFDHFGDDTQVYGYSTAFGIAESCEQEVVDQLVEFYERATELASMDGRVARDEYFFARQNVRLVKNAEEYYRKMYRSDVSSWNLRDTHMTETLAELDKHISAIRGRPARIVVWEHNSHLGDARHTEMGDRGEWNVGQLARQKYGADVYSVGFTTDSGTVTAASNWGEPAERKRVRPAIEGSVERFFHAAGIERFLLLMKEGSHAASALTDPLLERAIGVIYKPETERQSHYFYAKVARQFDSVIHIDRTRAVEPLERNAKWEEGEAPETYPTGI